MVADLLALYVDHNSRERLANGGQATFIPFGRANPVSLLDQMKIGLAVCLYDEDIRCVAVARKSWSGDEWVAEIVEGTVTQLRRGEFENLVAKTKRAALRVVD